MYTNIRVSEQWGSYVKEYGDIIGLSISAAGELQMVEDEDGDMVVHRDEDTGLPILKRLLSAEESPYNSIDFVEAPGADGRIVAALESAKSHLLELNIREQAKFASGITEREERKASEAVPPQNTKEGIDMDKDVEAIVEAAATAAVTKAIEALKPAETPQEVKFEDVAEAAFEAGLSKGSRSAVYESVRSGATVEDAIARESAREEEIKASVRESLEADFKLAGFTTGGVNEGARDRDTEFEQYVGEGVR